MNNYLHCFSPADFPDSIRHKSINQLLFDILTETHSNHAGFSHNRLLLDLN